MSAGTPFLDTNIILRHLTGDHPEHSPRSLRLMNAVEQGKTVVWTTHLAVAEAVFVLTRLCGFSRQQIADRMLPIIEFPGIKLTQKRLFRRVFDLFTSTSLGFVDCYHAALVELREGQQVISFDTDFDKVAGITRIEP